MIMGLALPVAAQAQPVMDRETCRAGWQTVNAAMGQAERFQTIEPKVTDDGWCRIDRSVADLRDKDFSELEWRATGVTQAIEASGFPESLEARFSGIDMIEAFGMDLPQERAGAMAGLTVLAERNPETLDFAIQAMDFDFGALGAAKFSLIGGGIDLSGLKRMQITIGGLRIREAALSLDTTPDLSRALSAGLAGQQQLALMREVIRALPDDTVSEESRAALVAFLEAAPAQDGTLELRATSEAGLGMIQLAGGGMKLGESVSDEDVKDAAALLLSGVRIEATWIPRD
ncbi:hypothetical protein [Roseovarius sp. THAF27]|uniref:hypothetical protein n=1 Tax=Roseovarius sp. THAF27 TaxID=2587850 RepID=UPI0015629ED4|nr:hypothetical protein [Roseovarius sp. THAF27]